MKDSVYSLIAKNALNPIAAPLGIEKRRKLKEKFCQCGAVFTGPKKYCEKCRNHDELKNIPAYSVQINRLVEL